MHACLLASLTRTDWHVYVLLNPPWNFVLVLTVGTGVGLAAVFGIVRLLRSTSVKVAIYVTLVPTMLLTL